MEQAIRERFSKQILAETAVRYAVSPEQIENIGGFESFMFSFEQNGRPLILRLAHSIRRTPDLIRGEVDWINYLASGGAGVARAVLSANGELVELIDDGQGGHFLATAFVKAKGGSAWQDDQWQEPLWVEYGRLLGKIHALTKNYQPANPAWQRPSWDDPIMRMDNWLPDSEKLIQEKFQAVIHHLQSLSHDPDGYGLIHQDAHAGNFFVEENGRITLFDFDDCVYGHFVYDIAMALFYAVANRPDAVEFGHRFLTNFWRGYRQENRLDPRWFAEIPNFLKLREFDLYAVIFRSFDLEKLDEHPWVAAFMDGRKQKLEDDVPFLDLSWTEFSELAEPS